MHVNVGAFNIGSVMNTFVVTFIPIVTAINHLPAAVMLTSPSSSFTSSPIVNEITHIAMTARPHQSIRASVLQYPSTSEPASPKRRRKHTVKLWALDEDVRTYTRTGRCTYVRRRSTRARMHMLRWSPGREADGASHSFPTGRSTFENKIARSSDNIPRRHDACEKNPVEQLDR